MSLIFIFLSSTNLVNRPVSTCTYVQNFLHIKNLVIHLYIYKPLITWKTIRSARLLLTLVCNLVTHFIIQVNVIGVLQRSLERGGVKLREWSEEAPGVMYKIELTNSEYE